MNARDKPDGVGRLGFGCSGALGKPWFPERDARAVLAHALALGVRHFDTAGFYADGEAERRLGAALGEFGETVFVSTKTGTQYRRGGAAKDFSAVHIRADVMRSLERLRRDTLDLVYLHGPDADQHREGVEALAQLREEGLVNAIGVCGEGEGLARAAGDPDVDAIMGAYNFLRREHRPAFERAACTGKSVVAIAPLAQGLYDDAFFRIRSRADLWRVARALVKNRSELRRARAARASLKAIDGWTPAQAALGFVLAHDFVDIALTSTTRIEHLDETLGAASRFLPAALLKIPA